MYFDKSFEKSQVRQEVSGLRSKLSMSQAWVENVDTVPAHSICRFIPVYFRAVIMY
jgi:hypothetical protein